MNAGTTNGSVPQAALADVRPGLLLIQPGAAAGLCQPDDVDRVIPRVDRPAHLAGEPADRIAQHRDPVTRGRSRDALESVFVRLEPFAVLREEFFLRCGDDADSEPVRLLQP